VSNLAQLDGWPEGSAFLLARVAGDSLVELAAAGDADAVRPWASVTKLAVALAVARGVDRGAIDLATPAGPPGSTLAHLLAHASGLGLETRDAVAPVGTRRIYSNAGIDLAVATVLDGADPAPWLGDEVFGALAMSRARLVGRPAAGAEGSVRDLLALAVAWSRPQVISAAVRDQFIAPFLPALAGVVPGFGRFDPCEWGLGPEIHGAKDHWMGRRCSPRGYGHFGQSGSLVLIDPDRQLVLVAAAGAPFGPWAVRRWPRWTDEILEVGDAV
jgi:CubicO group peptidase (beta-lactamase class C family)